MPIGLARCRALATSCLGAFLLIALVAGCARGVVPTHLLAADGPGAERSATRPVAKPVHVSLTWAQREAVFGQRVHEAFGVPLERTVEFAGWILEAAARQQLAPELIASLVFTESSFRKQVRSPAGAIGPAQIKPRYWADFCGLSDLRDPEQNIYCGAQVLAHLEERCGGLACALASYNVGINAWQRKAGLRYVSRIERHRSKFDRI